VIQWKLLEHKAKLPAPVANNKSDNEETEIEDEEDEERDELMVGKVSLVLAAKITP